MDWSKLKVSPQPAQLWQGACQVGACAGLHDALHLRRQHSVQARSTCLRECCAAGGQASLVAGRPGVPGAARPRQRGALAGRVRRRAACAQVQSLKKYAKAHDLDVANLNSKEDLVGAVQRHWAQLVRWLPPPCTPAGRAQRQCLLVRGERPAVCGGIAQPHDLRHARCGYARVVARPAVDLLRPECISARSACLRSGLGRSGRSAQALLRRGRHPGCPASIARSACTASARAAPGRARQGPAWACLRRACTALTAGCRRPGIGRHRY